MLKYIFILTTLLMFPMLADAHTMTYSSGFLSGIKHPVLGIDHLLAMLSVGILSAQLGGRLLWAMPALFVGMMAYGGMLGMRDFPLISVELGIQISVIVLGIAIFTAKKLPLFLMLFFVAFFGVFHGYAHGVEIPYLAKPAFYVMGFVLGSALIHAVGVLLGGYLLKSSRSDFILRTLGAVIASVGLCFMLLGFM